MELSISQLLAQGLLITVLGIGLVFAALGLLWGMMVLLTRIGAGGPSVVPAAAVETTSDATVPISTAAMESAALTVERAQVAALMAGALMANALPWLAEAPSGPVFEHGRTAPIWVSANRARMLRCWQPPRHREDGTAR